MEPLNDPAPRASGLSLALAGAAVLAVGLAALQTGNFVAAQFERAAWLGWTTLGVASLGFGLLFASVWRELAALFALGRVDALRTALASGDAPAHSCRGPALGVDPCRTRGTLVPAIDAVNDPDAIVALLRAWPRRRHARPQ